MNPDQRRRRRNEYYLDPVTDKPEPWVFKPPALGMTPYTAPNGEYIVTYRQPPPSIHYLDELDIELQLEQERLQRLGQGARAMYMRMSASDAMRRSDLESMLQQLPRNSQGAEAMLQQLESPRNSQGAEAMPQTQTPQINTSRIISEESPRISEESPRISEDLEGSPISLLRNSNKKKKKCCNIMGGSTRRPKSKSKSKSPKPKNRSRRRRKH
jgi:hypothetical protein